MDKKVSFGYRAGQFIANVFVACCTICVSAILIALTIRFIAWLF